MKPPLRDPGCSGTLLKLDEPKIIDSTITPDFEQCVLLQDAVPWQFLVAGPTSAKQPDGRAVKKLYPETHTLEVGTFLIAPALEADFVDVVVVKENSLLKVVERLTDRAPLKDVSGIGFKEDGRLVMTPERPLLPLRELPPKAYELGDYDAYERLCGRRWAMYISSLACPYNCAYCTNEGVYGRLWNALPAEQVVSEMTDLVRRYRFELLWVVDDNFLVDRHRAVAIAEGLVRSGVKFQWSIQASTNLVTRLSDPELKLLREAGLQQICHGASRHRRSLEADG